MKVHLATCVRNEGPYLLEWVAFNRMIGFDSITIYSNDNDDGSDELLRLMQDHGLITWIPRTLAEGESPQLSAYKALNSKVLNDPALKGDYLTWLDCDEYLVLHKASSVSEFLHDLGLPDAVMVNWKHFGSGGHLEYTTEPTISRFVMGSDRTRLNKFFKTIARIDKPMFVSINNHRPILRHPNHPYRIIYPHGVTVPKTYLKGENPVGDDSAIFDFSVAQLNHYAVRTQEEYGWKVSRGNGRTPLESDKAHFPENYFKQRDFAQVVDTVARDRYLAPLLAETARLPEEVRRCSAELIGAFVASHRGSGLST